MDYAVLEISGKQYKALPNKPFEVDLQNGDLMAKVLMLSKAGKISLGKPVLADKINLKVVEPLVKKEKIRVAQFHAKANYRRVTGARKRMTRIIWEA